jgi:membrane protease YdiL (CAAX protease family)
MTINSAPSSRPSRRKLIQFLALTFGISWIIDVIIWLTGGLAQGYQVVVAMQLQMLVPAFSAIFLSIFVFRDSRIYRGHYRDMPRLFFYFYLVFFLVYVLIAAWAMLNPEQVQVISAIIFAWNIIGLMVLLAVRALSGKEAFSQAGLSGGKLLHWLVFGAAFIGFIALQAALNAWFVPGTRFDLSQLSAGLVAGGAPESLLPPAGILFAMAAFQSVLINSFIGLMAGFGEEYGWRGFLQNELLSLGRMRGVILVGLVWGIWHLPLIWMGFNYPGYPLLGSLLMVIFSMLLGFILSYAMLKTAAIWLVSFLHVLANQAMSFGLVLVFTPKSPVYAFGAGLFGLFTLLLVVLLLSRDPVWRLKGETPVSTALIPEG